MVTSGAGGRRRAPWRLLGWGAAGLLLLLPLVTKAPWTLSDFVFAGVLLGGVGLGLELAVRFGDRAYALGAAAALAAAFLLVWLSGAVGLIGSEDEDANLLYGGVLAVALLGAVVGRFRPAGMARAMAAAAVVQALVPVVALVSGLGQRASIWSPEVPVLTLGFAALWLVSAWLFRRAARDQAPAGSAP